MAGYSEAKALLEKNVDQLKALAEALLEHETLDTAQVDLIARGEKLPPMTTSPKGRPRAALKPSAVFVTREKGGIVPDPKPAEST